MGGSESKATVLECMIKNFKKGLGGDYGVKMKPNRLHILCEVEWPPMEVGWPPENTMNLKIVPLVRDLWKRRGQGSNNGLRRRPSKSNAHE